MPQVQIDILPGGMLSDVVENKLGAHQHQEVVNLRQVKAGLWESRDGYVNLKTSAGTNIKAAIEVTDDLSGDRFILYQDGTSLKRLDYDDGDGNGYENETPSTLTLPSGVTIASTATCRFFFHNGVVRISGPSEPLWYGYINRTIFPNAWEEIELGKFETTTESWSGNSATLSRYNCAADADGSGTAYAPEGTYALKVLQAGAAGSARKSFTVESGATGRVLLMAFSTAADCEINIGSTAGGSEYATLSISAADAWEMLESDEITFTGTTLYVEMVPSAAGSSEIGYFDFVFIEQKAEIELSGWYLQPVAVTPQTVRVTDAFYFGDDESDTESRSALIKGFSVFDDAQFSLLEACESEVTSGYSFKYTMLNYESGGWATEQGLGLDIEIRGTALKTAFTDKRFTRLGIAASILNAGNYSNKESDFVYYLLDDIDCTEENSKYFAAFWWYQEAGFANKIRLYETGGVFTSYDEVSTADDHNLQVGKRISLVLEGDELNTIITEIGETSGAYWFKVAHDVETLFGQSVPYIAQFGVTLEDKWIYSPTTGYKRRIGFDPYNLINEFHDYTGIPSGTLDINPNYTHHAVVNKRGWVLSSEDEEEDILRYSPINQFDVFPSAQVESNDVGDRDRNLALVNRDNRVAVLKRKALSQWHLAGSSFNRDIAFIKKGLYPTNGYLMVDNDLYFMDKDDLYVFSGNTVEPVMMPQRLKTLYQQYVSSGSFLVYNKIDRELLVVLNGYILSFHPEMGEWYKFSTNITPLGGFLDDDNRLVLFTATGFVLVNHDGTTFDESVSWSFKTRQVDLANPDAYKMIEDLEFISSAPGTVSIVFSDENESATATASVVPAATTIGVSEEEVDYVCREFEVDVSGVASASTKTQIRKLTLRANQWR